jgi:hypothetical protein
VTFRSLLISTATVTRETEDGFDDYGNVVKEWDEIYAAMPCRLDERQGSETIENRNTVERVGTLFAEGSYVLSALDRIEIDGDTWEVTGPPVPRQNSVSVHHLEVPVRRVVV